MKIPDEPECRIDSDCPSQHACIEARCQNPCRYNNPCVAGQECVVEDTLPTRTIACVCPDGYVVGNNGECNRIDPQVWSLGHFFISLGRDK